MSDRAAIRTSIIRNLPSFLADHGCRADAVLDRAGIVVPLDEDPPRIVSRAQLCAAVDAAARLVGDEAFALRFGQRVEPLHLGPSGHALATGLTVRQCLDGQARLMPSLQSAASLDLVVRGRSALWRHQLLGSDPAMARGLYEGAASFMVTNLRRLAGPAWAPTLVCFPHPAPGDRRPYEHFFRSPVRFGVSGPSLIVFDAAILDRPTGLVAGWHAAASGSSDHAVLHSEIDRFEISDETLVRSVEAIIDGMMVLDQVSLPAAAAALGLSSRTLQRRLALLDLSFEALTDRRRRHRAAILLADPDFRVIDVAMALGYSDNAHFTRAFHRWHGQSPVGFRRQLAAENAG